MGIVVGALTKFAKSGIGTTLYKWGTSEKGKEFLCVGMPLIDTVLATGSRVYATEKQKLPRREKNILQAGHIVPAIFGLGIGSVLNKKVFGMAESISKYLDPKKVKDVDKVKTAIQVLAPMLTMATLMRFALPVATAFVSGEIEEKKAKKKLDIKA